MLASPLYPRVHRGVHCISGRWVIFPSQKLSTGHWPFPVPAAWAGPRTPAPHRIDGLVQLRAVIAGPANRASRGIARLPAVTRKSPVLIAKSWSGCGALQAGEIAATNGKSSSPFSRSAGRARNGNRSPIKLRNRRPIGAGGFGAILPLPPPSTKSARRFYS